MALTPPTPLPPPPARVALSAPRCQSSFVCYFAAGNQAAIPLAVAAATTLLNSFVVLPFLLDHFYFLHAVSVLDVHALGHTVEDMEEAHDLKLHLISKLCASQEDGRISRRPSAKTVRASQREALCAPSSLESLADQRSFLENEFEEWAKASVDDGVVDRKELRMALTSLGIYLGRLTFNKLFRLLDPMHTGGIGYSAFGDFVCGVTAKEYEDVLRKARGHETSRRLELKFGDQASAEWGSEGPSGRKLRDAAAKAGQRIGGSMKSLTSRMHSIPKMMTSPRSQHHQSRAKSQEQLHEKRSESTSAPAGLFDLAACDSDGKADDAGGESNGNAGAQSEGKIVRIAVARHKDTI